MLGDVFPDIAPDTTELQRRQSWDHLSVEDDIICLLEQWMERPHCNSISVTPDGDWLVRLSPPWYGRRRRPV